MRLLNLGCGSTFHEAWVNVDIHASSAKVIEADLRGRLPFPDGQFDAVYHSHVLEHFPADQAERFLREAIRVLRPGGTMRIVVPDLEQIARLYLEALDAARHGGPAANHQWMMLELYDQTVRTHSGGRMKDYLKAPQIDNLDFVRSRIGAELDAIRQPRSRSLWNAIRSQRPARIAKSVRRQLARSVLRVVGGRDALAALDEGRFRNSGEVHQWMYDAFSLARLLERVGMQDVQRCDAQTSRIPGFASYQLDAIDGVPRKPDSMYVEAVRQPSV